MGQDISQITFTESDRKNFQRRLDDSLLILDDLLSRADFGQGASSIGAELELYIIDKDGLPTPLCTELIAASDDKRLTPEINRYNIEINLTPGLIAGTPFSTLEKEMLTALQALRSNSKQYGVSVVPVGILPTLRPRDLVPSMMTPSDRYAVISRELRKRRGEKFKIKLNGKEKLSVGTDSVTPEGANTSFQLHYRAHPDRLVDLYNAVQLVTPLVLSLSANSPFMLGRELWHESRIGVFRQSIDGRSRRKRELKVPARVHFGHGWLRRSVHELFAESVHLFDPLLPICSDEDPIKVHSEGVVPTLNELALQMGTIWPWNRPVYDNHDNGHVRLELRYLPAGPTPADMLANSALAIGLAEALIDDIEDLLPSIPYAIVQRNLMVAAREGMNANLLWPSRKTRRLMNTSIVEIALDLLPCVEAALHKINIAPHEARHYLGIMEQRLDSRQNGATWQMDLYRKARATGSKRQAALRSMTLQYAQLSQMNIPVGQWSIS